MSFPDSHLVSRIGWLGAAVLGATGDLVSIASLIAGISVAPAAISEMLMGVASPIPDAMSRTADGYVSGSSESASEQADLAREEAELASRPEFERATGADLHRQRRLTRSDALGGGLADG